LRPNGQVFATQSGNYPLLLNRTTSDGDIVSFRKDGTTVGSIGSVGGANLSIKSDDGVLFIGGDQGGAIRAINGIGSGQPRLDARDDATTDLGTGTNRFKDLYLSGNLIASGTSAQHSQIVSSGGDAKLSLVCSDSHDAWINYSGATNEMSAGYDRGNSTFNFSNADTIASNIRVSIRSAGGITFNGDTAEANALDDYEEGTWTPVLGPGSSQAYGNRSGHYTKVGRMVTAYFGARLTAGTFTGGEATITGLPFAVHTTGSYQEPQFVIYTLGGAPTGQTNGLNNGAYLPGQVSFYLNGGETQGRGRKYSTNADSVLDANEVFDSNTFIKGIVTYYTA
jgi:hypothetical protein